MCEQQVIYFIFGAACYHAVIMLQTYIKEEKKALYTEEMKYYMWYRLLFIIRASFLFWATLYGPSKVFLGDPMLVINHVTSDIIFAYTNYPFLLFLFLCFCILYFQVIYYLAENYHHINLLFLFVTVFIIIYILENYLL